MSGYELQKIGVLFLVVMSVTSLPAQQSIPNDPPTESSSAAIDPFTLSTVPQCRALATACVKAGRYADAATVCERLLVLDPDNAPTTRHLLLQMYLKSGQKDKADALAETLAADQPDPAGFLAGIEDLNKKDNP